MRSVASFFAAGRLFGLLFLRSVGSGGGFAGFDFLEEPDAADAGEEDDGEPAEDIDEGPVEGLSLELLVEEALGHGE